MHTTDPERWTHHHVFTAEEATHGERRTLLVALLTAVFMGVEIAAGIVYGSMALLADGLHMGSHAVALGIAVAAYVYARRRARDERFSFGTGKVNALGGFTGATLLACFAVLMAWESVARFIHPVPIGFDQALAVAVLGLVVNGVSVAMLGIHDHGHEDDPGHSHDHGHADHNLRSAYLHVLADALTSFAAIFALLAGKYFGQAWLDPAMGVVGSLLVARWSWGLLRDTSNVLLDHQAPARLRDEVRAALEGTPDERVVDLHVWSIGPGAFSLCATIVANAPRTPEEYKAALPAGRGLRHATLEVHRCPGPEPVDGDGSASK